MDYAFPLIPDARDVLAAVEGRDEFIVGERDGFFFIDYAVALTDSFPDPKEDGISTSEAVRRMLVRECRGIKFDDHGNIIGRPYHKFFNVNERNETQHHAIDWSQPFYILDKLDGSMIHPIMLQGEIQFCTRMGLTDVAAQALVFAKARQAEGKRFNRYMDFCNDLMKYGYTPIFEWCSKRNRIVVPYAEENLHLTAIRHMKSGMYLNNGQMWSYAGPYGIPVVQKWQGTFSGIEKFIADVRGMVNSEGYVLRFYDGPQAGHMVKLKNEWYVAIHKAKDAVRFEKDVIRLHLSGQIDDVFSHLLEYDRKRIAAFTKEFDAEMQSTVNYMRQFVMDAHAEIEALGIDDPRAQKKEFAHAVQNNFRNPEMGILFKIWDGKDPLMLVRDTILNKTHSSTQVDEVRSLFKVDFDDF